jgi:hypothetical protein
MLVLAGGQMRPENTLDEWLQRLSLSDGKPPRLNDAGVAFITVSGEYSIGIAVNARPATSASSHS